MRREFLMAMTLLVSAGIMAAAQAQSYRQPPYGSNVVIVPPAYPGSGNTGGGYDMPFPSPQAGQQRLLEMLDTGGTERTNRGNAAQPGCVHSGQIYSEGAVVRNEAESEVCGLLTGAEPDASGRCR